MPYLTPESIPPGKICRALRIPNDPDIIACVTGALEQLTFAYNWEKYGAVTPDEIASAMIDLFDNFVFQTERCRMIGSIIAAATEDAPFGTLLCDGATYLGADYPALFAVIASEFKSGANFTVPDLRGRVVMGVGPGFAFSADGGQQNATINIDSMPSHDHSVNDWFTALALAPGELPVLIPSPFPSVTGLTGGDQEHNNLQPFLVLNYYIVAEG